MGCICQVPPQHLGDAIFEEGKELQMARERQRQYFRASCKRKMGGHPDAAAPPPRKRRRVKTYVTIMMIDNVLRTSTNLRLSDFRIERTPDGKDFAGDPFEWPSLSLATDSGPDCVCSSAASAHVEARSIRHVNADAGCVSACSPTMSFAMLCHHGPFAFDRPDSPHRLTSESDFRCQAYVAERVVILL